MLNSYKRFVKYNKINESAPRIPNKKDYWINKGKKGKNVMLYFHDDLDGIYSAIVMKNYLESKGFKIDGYGLVNYQEGWSLIKLNPKTINIALDYAENVKGIDVYMDHHGSFKEGENDEINAVKTHTGSAYEGICDELGLPVDSLILNVIDMVDSAKYDYYKVDIKNILKFGKMKFKNKLEFASAFNQLLKRSEYKTFIEVVDNTKDIAPSVYNLFRLFKILYPANNLDRKGLTKLAKEMDYVKDNGRGDPDKLIDYLKKMEPKLLKDFEKNFLDDAFYRMEQKDIRTWGKDQHGNKQYIDSQEKFKKMFSSINRFGKPIIKMPGYQIIGNMCFVPSGTWANALTARSLLERDLLNDKRIPIIDYHITKDSKNYDKLKKSNGKSLELVGDLGKYEKHKTLNVKIDVTNNDNIEGIKGIIYANDDDIIFKAKQPIFWIMLQYGNTLQVASLHDFDKYVKKYLPKLKDGTTVLNLGHYCENLLNNFVKYFGYNIDAVPSSTTKAGGHKGIGSISNIFGEVTQNTPKGFKGSRFLDLMKNKMIDDLSGIDFKDIKMPWGDKDDKPKSKPRDEDMNKKVLMKNQIRNAQEIKKEYDELKKYN